MSTTLLLTLTLLSAPADQKAVGMNLDFHKSYGSQLIFVDAIKHARTWISFPADTEEFQSGITIPFDAEGYPLYLPYKPAGQPAQSVRTIIFDGIKGRYPSGMYTFTFEGTGVIELRRDFEHTTIRKAGRYPIQVTPSDSGLEVILHQSSKSDPIRNIHLWLPGFENAKSALHPRFVEGLKGFSVVRPTQTMSVNGGDYPCDNNVEPTDHRCTITWGANRPKPADFTQASRRGVAIEYMVDVANAANSDFWPGIPHAVDDKYVRKMAQLIKKRLKSNLKVYIELSNEVWNWNGHYPQHDYFHARAKHLKMRDKVGEFKNDKHDAGRKAFVKRQIEIFEIFKEVFGSQAKQRLVNVLPVFFGNDWYSERLLQLAHRKDVNPNGTKIDAIAVGAYFSGMIANQLAEKKDKSLYTADEIFRRSFAHLGKLTGKRDEETFAYLLIRHAEIAKKYKTQLVAYEGGQHLVVGLGEEHPIVNVLQEVNRDPRMGQLYKRVLDMWFKAGGGVYVAYSYAAPYSHWGTWGHLEWTGQPYDSSVKYMALRNKMKEFGVPMPENKTKPYAVPAAYKRKILQRS